MTKPNHRPSTTKRKSRRSRKTIAAACVLAATAPSGGVEAFGPRSPAAAISAMSMSGARRHSGGGTASPSRSHVAAPSHRRQTRLGYREGDEDQSPAQKRQQRRAVAASSASLSDSAPDVPRPTTTTTSCDSQRPGFWSLLHRRRKITARNNHTASEQFKLDEYLEFIDKRYKRMHGNDSAQGKVSSVGLRRQATGKSQKTSSSSAAADRNPPSDEDNGVSTAWNWLLQDSSDAANDCGCDAACQEQKRQDALEVLGLAGLASAELLRKHQLPVPEEAAVLPIGMASAGTTATGPSIAGATDIIDVQPTRSTDTGRLSVAATPQHRLARLTTLLALTIRSMLYKTIVATLLATKTVLAALPALPAKMGEVAGGRRAVKMATAVALGVFCAVVKPLGLLALRAAGGQN